MQAALFARTYRTNVARHRARQKRVSGRDARAFRCKISGRMSTPVQSQSTEALSMRRKNPKRCSTYHQARLQRQRPNPRLLLRLRHDGGGRRETRPPLDRLRPRPLRRPHHPQAPAQHRRRQAVPGAEPRQVRAAAVAGRHISQENQPDAGARETPEQAAERIASTPTSSSGSTTPRRCPAGRCCTASRTAGSSTSAASRRR